jgi:hypothetical protein
MNSALGDFRRVSRDSPRTRLVRGRGESQAAKCRELMKALREELPDPAVYKVGETR